MIKLNIFDKLVLQFLQENLTLEECFLTNGEAKFELRYAYFHYSFSLMTEVGKQQK